MENLNKQMHKLIRQWIVNQNNHPKTGKLQRGRRITNCYDTTSDTSPSSEANPKAKALGWRASS